MRRWAAVRQRRERDRMCLKGCGCLTNKKGEVGKRLKEIWDEVVEVPVWYDERHVRKIEARFEEYGCVRSKRNLVGGKCPAAAGK